MPRQPSRTPTTSCPRDHERRATARMTAFRPGQSPPPVSTPICIDLSLRSVRAVGLRVPGTMRSCTAPLSSSSPPSVFAAGGAAASSGGRPSLTGAAPCPAFAGYTCSTLAVPLDHAGRTARDAAARRRGRRQRARAARRVAPDHRRPGPARRAGAGAHPEDPRRRAARLPDRRLRPAGHRRRGARLSRACSPRWAAPTSGRRSAAAVRACSRQLGARRQFFGTDDVVADMESLRRALGVDRWTLDGISYGSYVGERYALAHPDRVQRLVLDSVVPHVGQTDLGVVEFRATARVLRSICGATCVADLAAVVRARHNGAQLLDALTLLSIVDPTYRTLVRRPPAATGSTRRQPHRPEQLPGDRPPLERDAGGGARPGPARERSLRGLAVPVGLVRGAARGTRGEAPPRGREARADEARAVRPRDGRRHRLRPSVPAVGADTGDTPRPAQADRADAARERRPRPLDAARVGTAGARPDDARQARRRARRRALDAVARGQRRRAERGRELPAERLEA